jgi:hypothetical protein
MSYPTTSLSLTPRELELVVNALADGSEEYSENGWNEMAAEMSLLLRRFQKAHDSLFVH